MTSLSVVVPFLNPGQPFRECLEGLLNQNYEHSEFILVDNGSTDGSAEAASQFATSHSQVRWKLLHEGKPGASAARNAGAREASGDWLVFTDADCVPEADWLRDLVAAIGVSSDSIAALAGCIKPDFPINPVAKFLGVYTLPPNREERLYREFTLVRGGFPTANLAVRRDVFQRIEGFDESIPIYGEDHGLCAAIYESGYAIKTLTKALVRHHHRTNLGGLLRQSFGFGKSHALALRYFVPGACICRGPGFSRVNIRAGARLWIDFNQADKKMLAALLAGYSWWPLWLLPLAYFAYLCGSVFRKNAEADFQIQRIETPVLALLLLTKSASLTFGRLVGSIRYGVLCV